MSTSNSPSHKDNPATLHIPSLQRATQPDSSVAKDWIGRLLAIAQAIKVAGGLAPFPWIKDGADVVISLLKVMQVIVLVCIGAVVILNTGS
jgi:hypothetical protein